ncbi:MAG: outer membrane lipoprotein chaperone LolA [Deltaproteobacteria bacterium]
MTVFGCATILALAAAPGPQPEEARVTQARPKPQLYAQAGAAKKGTPKKVPTTKSKAIPAAKANGAVALVAKVEGFYKNLQDYSAEFIQTYTRVALSKTSESRGQIAIKKPGLMKWTYEKPAKKLWVVDGEKLWVEDPEEMQVFVDDNYKTTELTNSIQFLWGEGKLTDSFNATVGDAKTYEAPKGHEVLVLKPKRGASYAKLVLFVDSKTGAVQSSTIFETSGNKNHFKFKAPKINAGMKASDFAYTPPKNFEVIHQ